VTGFSKGAPMAIRNRGALRALPRRSARTDAAPPAGGDRPTVVARSGRRAAPSWWWPVALIVLLVAGAAANIGLMVVASRDATFAVEPDYYKKALDWDRTVAQEAVNGALGWTMSAEFERGPTPGEVRLVARIVDREGAPLTGARVVVQAFASARARQVYSAALEPRSAGVYTAILPSARRGLWEIRAQASRGGDVFTQTLSRDLPAFAR
jgi:nitrogen fixation protein FixH